jgi:signal transduction histidine kinase
VDQYLLTPGERPKVQFRSIHRSQKRLLETIKAKTDEEREVVNRIWQNHESIAPLFNLLVKIQEAPAAEKGPASAELRETVVGQLLALSREIVSDSFQLSKISEDRMDSVQGWSITVLFILALIPGIGLAVLSYFMGRNIERSSEELQGEITERRRAEEALQKHTLELQHLTETLEEKVKERTAELAELSLQLVSAQENERRRVSYDLHDNIWQTIEIIRTQMERLFSRKEDENLEASQEQAKQLAQMIRETVAKIRSMQGDLWPFVLDDIGLLATFGWFCREFGSKHPGISVELLADVTEDEVPSPAKIVMYRVLQEALENVSTHSRASRVTVGLRKQDHRVELTVQDNGTGFFWTEAVARKAPWGGLGLLSIKARTELSGGSFEIESANGKGTIIRASWPL